MPCKRIALDLPPEFVSLCKTDGVAPQLVLRGFIADLCEIISSIDARRADGYSSNGSDERCMAREYYERVGYPWLNKPRVKAAQVRSRTLPTVGSVAAHAPCTTKMRDHD